MDLTRRLQYAALTLFLITLVIGSSHTRLHGRRHKRQHGAHLYLPESYIVPEGEGRRGEWGDWGSPSECSRTCGGGVAYQTRECLNVGSDGTPRCSGGDKKYFSCNSQDCPESELDFRSQQCAHFDSVPFEGVRYSWVPYTKAPNPCELNCMPKGERFYYRHKAKVIDGTPCNDESLDVCVDGQCQPVGCDMMLGSSAREDKCRKCAGDGSSCKTVSGILDMNDLQVGYNDILLIPSGATNVEIREISPSNNYLAIRNLAGHYYLNGNWRIDFPRPLTFANAIWHYDRKPQGFAAPDHVTCMGPISEPVYLVLLYQDRNVGIRYEYSVPESSAHLSEPETYAWTFTDFGPCSSTCGGGVQTRTVTCNGRTNLTRVDDELCDISNKPNESQKCGKGACPANWKEGPFGKCSAPCGNNGTQSRTVTCEKVLENGSSQPIDDSVCLEQVGAKPSTISECNVGKICAEWHIGSWQPCDKLCGPGTQKRKLKCFHKVNGKIEVLDDDQCVDEKPEESRECTLRPCEGVDWITSSWSGCKTCGLTQETRTAHCASKSGTIYNETFCANRKKPELTRECQAPDCDYQWFKSQWSKCSAECGNGVQTRQIVCGKLSGNAIEKAGDESKCTDEKPIAEKECSVEKECPGQWFSGPWGECDKKCGGGKRTRKVLCIANGVPVKANECNEDTIEFSTDECNKNACIEDETIPVDSTSKPITEDDEGEDWCDDEEETETTDEMEIVKIVPTDSTGISDGFEVDSTSDATESSLITDDLMLSDATGFETDSTQTDSVTDISISTVDGSGDVSEDDRFAGTEGSGDDESTATTDGSSVTDSASSGGSDSTDQTGSDSTDQTGSDSTDSTDAAGNTSESSTDSIISSSQSQSQSESSSSSGASSDDLPTTAADLAATTSSAPETTTDLPTSDTTIITTTDFTTDTTTDIITTELSTEGTTEGSTEGSTGGSTEAATEGSTSGATEAASDASGTSTQSGTSIDLTETTDSSAVSESATSSGQTSSDVESSTVSGDDATDTTGISTVSQDGTDVTSSTDLPDASGATSSGTEETEATETTDTAGPTESTIAVSTEEDVEGTTVDIWSTTDSSAQTDEEDKFGSTPNTLEAIITQEQTPKKCKPRPKVSACLKSTFGCCADNTTAATGPFDEGCPVPETCADTKYGCCPDGLSPAEGKKFKGCPAAECVESLFGCCSDGITEAENEEQIGCPIITTTPAPTTTTKAPPTKASAKSDAPKGAAPPHKFCQDSQYGCCQDGVSEATGPRFHGCDCKKSEFGCCPDQRTPAEGPNKEGCSPCLSEPFGCCRDGVTPAHGPNLEGCCLESRFGCCPDNINEARGPNLEDCGCEYSPYGCCPDNKTSARGGDNDGCGCEHAPHGCCPDKLTPAKGPKFEGCPCHSFQFGCCPDGVTIPQGPLNYGCHCSQSEFKCCSDEVTPAKGPNFEGCTCATSKYGCCPDGQTEAQGSNFDGCEDIPKTPQKSCSLPKDGGTCGNFTVKNFFDVEYGACSRFWYSGCGGNDNRFETIEECKGTCEQAEGKSACLLPKIHGPCTGYYPSFYYDTDRNMCSQFVYGGCLGNNNRFETIEACQELCVVDKALPPCDQPLDEGPCHGSFESWYFDKESDTCRQFYFGGCKGNKNRYATEASCNYHCKAPGIHKEICALPKATGSCGGRQARWYYSESDKTCMPFYYSGCDGNKNNFVSQEECEQQCPPEIIKDLCAKPAELGEGQNYETRWYYDTKEERCRQFYYGGAGGNDNNFHDEQSCLARCEQQQTTTTTQRSRPRQEQRPQERPQQPGRFETKHCFLDYDSGECRVSEARYYYNKNEGLCDVFAYGGCGGNENNFHSAEECEQQCGDAQDLCGLPPVYGQCQDNATRWYYDRRSEECVEFTFSGCRGNKNNFYSEDECRNQCSRRSAPRDERTQAPPHSETESICSAPMEYGDCEDNVLSYFYRPDTSACEAFYYSGCGGNGNRFETEEQCERQCGSYRGVVRPDDNENVIDHGDTHTAVPDTCQQYIDACNRLNCPYGISRSYGPEDGCERCECDDPCRTYSCPRDSQCAVDITPDPQLGTAFTPICRQANKPGTCPQLGNSSRCDRECYNDADCRGDSKCCVAGCGYSCVLPAETDVAHPEEPVQTPVYYPGAQAPQLEEKPQEEVDVIQPEGDLATLRCFATGYPLPTVTWKRGQVIINTNQGRYVLTSTGDLQIVQVHRSDSGTYVCVADNGIGAPVEREVRLDVADPAQRKAYILGDTNSTKILTLNQPATVRCLAGGYPKPYVSWWRGTEMLPFSSARHEINRDFSLVFQRLELSDLGPYVCQAYSGEGKPVSMHVTLKAVGPVHVRNREDEQYLKYLVSSPEVPTTPRPDPRYPYRPIIKPPRVIPRPDIPVVVEEPQQPSVRVTAEMTLPNGHSFGVGSEISITCNVGGYPTPTVIWYKNDAEIAANNRIRIIESPHQLIISDTNADDAGFYKCAANNNISSAYHAEQITIDEDNVQGVYVPADCTDNPFFANCKLIVKAKYCQHKYYAKFCCKSCTLAGQLYYSTNRNY